VKQLLIGYKQDGSAMYLPADLTDKKIAMLAQSKKGKTYGLGVILEELAKAGQPFIGTDPADNLWGLRVLPNGSPSGLEIVLIGGSHADLPFDKDQGERMAELLLATPVCAIIDITSEMPGAIRTFMTAFSQRLMKYKPDLGRVIVLEEGPELIPQSPVGIQARMCRDAVAKLAVIGGNFGYGVIVASQRAATIDKNVLSQCEALIVMGMTHKKDRDTVYGWIEAKDEDGRSLEAFNTLGSLEPGEAWLWWPSEDRFDKFKFRKRETLHPREMRKLGLKSSAVELGDMRSFVDAAKKELTKTIVGMPVLPKAKRSAVVSVTSEAHALRALPPAKDHNLGDILRQKDAKIAELEHNLKTARISVDDSLTRLMAVRDYYRPQYEALKKLFEAMPTHAKASRVDRQKYEVWIKKAPRDGIRKMIEYLLENGSATVPQLGTIAGVSPRSTTNYVSWIKRNRIAAMNGGKIVLNEM
jgi:hypothetical protein